MTDRVTALLEWVRRGIIGTGYLGLAAIVVGIFVTFINRFHPTGIFDSATEISGFAVLGTGAFLLVASAFIVWKWFKREKD